MWHITRHMWHVTRDMQHVICDMSWGVNILSKFQRPSSSGLWFMIFWRLGWKDWMTESMNQWINHEADCRTAPATPGLLIIDNSTFLSINTLMKLIKRFSWCWTNPQEYKIISRPGRSQGLLYKHLCHWLSQSVSLFLPQLYGAATPKRFEIALTVMK